MDSFRSSKFVVVRWYPKLEPCPNKAGGESFWPNQFTPRHIMSLTNISHAILQVDSWPDSKQVLFVTFFCVHLEMSINGLLFLSQSFPWYASLVVATSTTNKRVELWVSAGPATMFQASCAFLHHFSPEIVAASPMETCAEVLHNLTGMVPLAATQPGRAGSGQGSGQGAMQPWPS